MAPEISPAMDFATQPAQLSPSFFRSASQPAHSDGTMIDMNVRASTAGLLIPGSRSLLAESASCPYVLFMKPYRVVNIFMPSPGSVMMFDRADSMLLPWASRTILLA